jgi:hypothetical protein
MRFMSYRVGSRLCAIQIISVEFKLSRNVKWFIDKVDPTVVEDPFIPVLREFPHGIKTPKKELAISFLAASELCAFAVWCCRHC